MDLLFWLPQSSWHKEMTYNEQLSHAEYPFLFIENEQSLEWAECFFLQPEYFHFWNTQSHHDKFRCIESTQHLAYRSLGDDQTFDNGSNEVDHLNLISMLSQT